jgi:NTP pyrophosphatase (non-canonical NTP hydrolase)
MNKELKFEEYQVLSQRTCASLGNGDLNSVKADLTHMVLGIGSELNELDDAISNNDIVNIGEELGGDVSWYLANYCSMRGINFSEFEGFYTQFNEVMEPNNALNSLYYHTSKLQDLTKKFMAYGKEIDRDKEKDVLLNIVGASASLCATYKINVFEQLYKNIEKLKARFPDKFTTEAAINRDTDVERAILEA